MNQGKRGIRGSGGGDKFKYHKSLYIVKNI
jgi:hypothetical protein